MLVADGDKHPFYPVGETLNAQLSTVTKFARTSVWDSAEINFEVAGSERLSITKNPAALDPSAERYTLSARTTFEPTYFAVLPNLDLMPTIGVGFNFLGNEYAGYSQNKGSGDLELGLTATYRVVWSASILYSHFLGSDRKQPLADRDFISLSLQRTF
jgi:hypothetical protein